MGNEQQQQLAGGGDGRHSESHGSRQDHHQEAAFGGHYDYDARSTAAAAGNSHPRSGGPRVEGRNGNEDDGGVDEAEDVKTKRPRESSLDSSYDQSRARQSSSQPPQQRQQRQQSEGDSKEEKKRRAFKACECVRVRTHSAHRTALRPSMFFSLLPSQLTLLLPPRPPSQRSRCSLRECESIDLRKKQPRTAANEPTPYTVLHCLLSDYHCSTLFCLVVYTYHYTPSAGVFHSISLAITASSPLAGAPPRRLPSIAVDSHHLSHRPGPTIPTF